MLLIGAGDDGDDDELDPSLKFVNSGWDFLQRIFSIQFGGGNGMFSN